MTKHVYPPQQPARKDRAWLVAVLVALVWIAALSLSLFAQSSQKTGAEFLNIPVGARPVGMGGAYTALANDISSLHWNPAGLALMNQPEIGAMYSQWLLDSQYNFLGLGYPLPQGKGTLAGSISVLSQGESQSRGQNRERTGSIKAQDQSLSLGYGRKIGFIRAGLNTKLIQSEIAGFMANSFAFDFGFIVPLRTNPISLGLALQNVGPGIRFIEQRDPLPLSLSGGLSYRLPVGIALALDVKQQLYSHKTNINIGTEYQALPVLSLRGGYIAALGQQVPLAGNGGLDGISGGVGFRLMGAQIDYAFKPFGLLGDTHRVSLSVRF
ncbi:MAG: PorV/PorQ family protein [Elusimicrobia bacterium]|nr:PorV/PorQ family protein [Elusimicrobiota bacterium]